MLLGHANRFPPRIPIKFSAEKKERSSSSKMNGHCARVLPAPVHNHPPLKERKKVTPTCPLPGRERKRFLTLPSPSYVRVSMWETAHFRRFFLAFRVRKDMGRRREHCTEDGKAIFFSEQLVCCVLPDNRRRMD